MLLRRVIEGLPSLIMLLLVAPTFADQPDAKKSPPYYPIKVGTKWVYQTGDADETRVVTKVDRKADATIVTIGRFSEGGKVVPLDVMTLSEKELSQFPAGSKDLYAPAVLLKFPLQVGEKWNYEMPSPTVLAPEEKGTMEVEGKEEITVPAGKFKTVRVVATVGVLQMGILRAPFKRTYWYSSGVGMVKTDYHDEKTTVLKSFSVGKD
jgi:hypothetical protein